MTSKIWTAILFDGYTVLNKKYTFNNARYDIEKKLLDKTRFSFVNIFIVLHNQIYVKLYNANIEYTHSNL